MPASDNIAAPADSAADEVTPLAANAARPARLPWCALCIWGVLVLLVPSFVQALNLVDVLAFPLGYFMTAQGILLGLLLVACVSARRQNSRAAGDGGTS